ncbi:MAG: T9SS type A sorting domain-containing protein, partial [Candidatus Marinimicrobia bacterium]|nr:T9SS type A sorting domain-containing protein [Candidatus Neomarinimicrobiota bacterium]
WDKGFSTNNCDSNDNDASVGGIDSDSDGICDGVDEYPNCTSNIVDCAGVCGGSAAVGGCDNACGSILVDDCLGDCGGSLIALDYCADIDGDGFGAGDIISYCLADLPADGSFVLDCSDAEPDCATNDIDTCDECGCLSIIDNIPEKFSINNIYPNPFNPVVNIQYSNDTVGNISIRIYNIKGEQIETLVDSHVSVGQHKVIWNASNHPTGIYIVRLTSPNKAITQKIILLK